MQDFTTFTRVKDLNTSSATAYQNVLSEQGLFHLKLIFLCLVSVMFDGSEH